ncbi:MAG: zinc ribbon domain-containing protein [Spirochaetales bacterium]|nr:zinc ribbon domain-containing protein [Spirochaetales bacterium]
MGEAKFYCESCNNPVEYDAEVCPYCGKLFDAVKCPVCKHIGRVESFINGCPKCGYCAPHMDRLRDNSSKAYRESAYKEKETPKNGFMSSWVYYSIAGGLFIAFLALVILYLRL